MAKARILAVVIIGLLLLTALVPGIASAAVPTVANYAPYNGATGIMLMPTLECRYTANPDPQGAARWQISTDNAFSDLVWDTGTMPGTEVTLDIPRGYLLPETTYYWRVMAQDVIGYSSAWSAAWSFTTMISFSQTSRRTCRRQTVPPRSVRTRACKRLSSMTVTGIGTMPLNGR